MPKAPSGRVRRSLSSPGVLASNRQQLRTSGRSEDLWTAALAVGRLALPLGTPAQRSNASRRLARPLWELSRVAQDIGSGRLSSRMHLRPHGPGEVREIRVLSYSINDM